jgi:ribosomal silencing factor RsfS
MPVIRDRLIKGDSKYAVDYITDAHAGYKYYHNRWQFLGDSYTGGYDFFASRYLEPYYYESRDDYEKRLRQVALDNHVSSIVGIYNSFLFRKNIKREVESLETDPNYQAFIKDADLDGRTFASFMRDVSAMAMVYGNAWVIVDKPNNQVSTRAEALQQGIRPYVSMFTPDNVLDWKYERQANGLYQLTYLKVKEEIIEDEQFIREYTPTEINVYKLYGKEKKGEYIETIPNTLGKIPAVCVYAKRSNIRGIGISAVGDIADQQRMIYEEYSEIEQIIRLTNHPTLVKTSDTEASAGAGSIVQLPQNLDPGLKPYLLQPNGSSIESVLSSIQRKVDAIDRMACLGGIRSVESRRLSGIGLQTEFQMLNAKLADFAMNLEHAEEQIWDLWSALEGKAFEGDITYPRSFSIQDKANDISVLKIAKDAKPADPMIVEKIDRMILETITEKTYDEVKEAMAEAQPEKDLMQHTPITDLNDMVMHLRKMVQAGYTDEEIKSLHPELAQLFTNGQSEA